MFHYLADRIALFKNMSFRFACIMNFFSAMAIGVAYISFSWHLLNLNNSINSIIIFMLTWWTSSTILSPLTGYFADKFSRRKIILITNALRVTLITAYIFWGTFKTLTTVYIFTSLWGLILAFFMPAMLVCVREVFPNDDNLMYANTTMDGVFEIGMLLGMSLGSILIAIFSMHDILFILLIFTSVAFLASFNIYPARKISKDNGNFVDNWIEVFKQLKIKKFIAWYYVAQISFTTFFMVVPSFLAPYAKNVLHATSLEFGMIETFFSIGFIIGTFIIPWFADKYGEVKTITKILIISSFFYFILAVTSQVWLATVAYFFVGTCVSCWPIVITLAQKNTDFKIQGKAQGIALGISGMTVMSIYGIFSLINYVYPLPSNRWFYFIIILAIVTIFSLKKGHKLQNNSNA